MVGGLWVERFVAYAALFLCCRPKSSFNTYKSMLCEYMLGRIAQNAYFDTRTLIVVVQSTKPRFGR